MNLPFSLNSEPVKILLILILSPLWLPFIRALWKELNNSLRDEGGVLGVAPTKKQLATLDRELGRRESTMVSETWEDHLAKEKRGSPARGGARRAPAARRPAAPPPKPRGFR